MATQIAYQPGPGLIEMRIPAGLQPDAKGHYHWNQIENCRRCGGQGGWQGWPGWTCYECGGGRKMSYPRAAVTRARAEKLQLNHERRQAKAAKFAAERYAAVDALLLPRCGLTTAQMADLADRFGGPALDIIHKMLWGASKATAKTGIEPSPAQWRVLEDLVARVEAIARQVEPPKVTLPAGRQTLTGTFVSVREQRNDFGTTIKGLLLVEADGECKVWMTAPKEAYEWDRVEGEPRPTKARLELAVTIEPAADPGFHYGTRPAKVRVLEESAA